MAHAIVFGTPDDPDYQAILAHIDAARRKLDSIKRFDMPGFQPNEHYVREMKRYGILPASFDPATDAVDPYETDRRYWDWLSRGLAHRFSWRWPASSRDNRWADAHRSPEPTVIAPQ